MKLVPRSFFTMGILGINFYLLGGWGSQRASTYFSDSFSGFWHASISDYSDFAIGLSSSIELDECYYYLRPFNEKSGLPSLASLRSPMSTLFLYSIQAFLSAILPSLSRYLRYLSLRNHSKNSLNTFLMVTSSSFSGANKPGIWLGPVILQILDKQQLFMVLQSHLYFWHSSATQGQQLELTNSRIIFLVIQPHIFLVQSDWFFFRSFLIFLNTLKPVLLLLGSSGSLWMLRIKGLFSISDLLMVMSLPRKDQSDLDRRTLRKSSCSAEPMP